jgi:transcriptional regulator with GAF, ATPase, and Fis domain
VGVSEDLPSPLALIAGRYEILREAGRGASGRVLLARDRAAGTLVALKTVAPELAGSLAFEFDVLAGVSHPNLARVHELLRIEHDADAFRLRAGETVLVEDFVDGPSAAARIEEAGPDARARVRVAVSIADSILRALAALHGAGIVHGDVKPANAIVERESGRAVLVDLGLASAAGCARSAAGTASFMAPEAFFGERSPKTDLYSLGATLHALLGGEGAALPSTRATLAELYARALAAPRSAKSLAIALPSELRHVIELLLAREPEARPASAREVLRMLATVRREIGLDAADVDLVVAEPSAAERVLALATLPLAGRDAELAALAAALESERVVAIRGPAGAGKSRLAREAVRLVQRRALERGASVPTYVRGPPPDGGHRVIAHVDPRIDDVARLRFDASLDGSRVTLLLEERAGDEAAIELAALDRASFRALFRSALADRREPSDAAIDAAYEATGGLPGRLLALAAAMIRESVPIERAEAIAAAAQRSSSDAAEIRSEHRSAAELLAIAGGALDARLLARDGHARTLVASGAVIASGTSAVLRPDLVDATYASIAAARRVELAHAIEPADDEARAFVHLERDRTDAASLFERAIAARRIRGDAEGAIALFARARARGLAATDAIRIAIAGAHRALGHYRAALETLGDSEAASGLLLRADLLRLAGDRDAAVELLARLPGAEALAIRARIEIDRGTADRAEGLVAGLDARELAPGVAARVAEVRVLAALARNDPRSAREAVQAAFVYAGARPEPAAAARLHALDALTSGAEGDAARAREHHQRAFELAERAGELLLAARSLVNVGTVELDLGAIGPALASLRDGARRLFAIGEAQVLGRVLYNLGLAATLAGEDDRARSILDLCETHATNDPSALAFARVLSAELALRGGSLPRARARSESALTLADSAGGDTAAIVAARHAILLASAGDRTRASDLAERAGSIARSAPALAEAHVAIARMRLLAGSFAGATRAALDARREAERAGSFEARLRAHFVSGDVAEASGDLDLAAASYASARSLLDRALATLDTSERARMRRVPGYQKAFVRAPAQAWERASSDRWRRLGAHARALAAERRSRRLYERLLEAALDLTGAERGFIVLREDGAVTVPVARNLDQSADAAGARFSRSIALSALDRGETITTVDAIADERLEGAQSVHALALRSAIAVPLRKNGAAFGSIYLDDRSRPGTFAREDEEILEHLASLGALAIESIDLLRRERRTARRLSVVRNRLARMVETQAIELGSLRDRLGRAEASLGIVAESRPMREALDLVKKVSGSDLPVLFSGESGTGKELLARALHELGPRRERAFVSESCAAIPEGLLESALFGHTRGAFTGATRERVGLFDAADGGTLFLDAIDEMSQGMQAKLLRVLEDGEVRPLGASRSHIVDVRVACATTNDLQELVARGRFREDLYYRIAVVIVRVPPLRDRRDDLAPLVAEIVRRRAPGRNVRVSPAALEKLLAYPWPGNVRELANEIERALVLAPERIEPSHLTIAGAETAGDLDLKHRVGTLERELVQKALDRSGGNQSQAARLLGVSRFGLQKMIKRLGI